MLIRTTWSCGLIHHVLDREVVGSNPTATGSHRFFHKEMKGKEIKSCFFKRWLSLGEHLFDHLLWSIFQSSIKRRWKVEPRSKYLTSSGAICILKILKLLILFISMCESQVQKKRLWQVHIKKFLRCDEKHDMQSTFN